MSSSIVRWLTVLPILAVVTVLAFTYVSDRPADAGGLVTQSLGEGSPALTAQDLANALAGGGVGAPTNVVYTGANVAAGTFSGGTGVVGFEGGVILSTGDISSGSADNSVIGPNVLDDVTTVNSTAGDAALTTLSGFPTADAAVLEFDFTPQSNTAFFRFVFASDEYNEWANTQYNDVFAFFINGTNCALVPGTSAPISVNTINNGNVENPNPPDPGPQSPSLYRDNDLDQGGATTPINTEMDGLTVVLTCLAAVNAGASNHIKLAIADANDLLLDSVVFLQSNSLVGSGPGDTDCNSMINPVDALQVLRQAAGLNVNAQCIGSGDVNCSGGLNPVDALFILRHTTGLTVTLPAGCPPIGSGPPGTGTPTASPTPSPTPGGLTVAMHDQGNSGFFDPAQLQVTAGQAFQISLTNAGPVSAHNVRIDADKNGFFVGNDFVTVCLSNCFDPPPNPTLLNPGGTGQVSGTLAAPGTYNFVCDSHPDMLGTITAN